MDPKLWPEGALVRWWRAPRVKPPKIDVNDNEVSDETMREMPMPNDSFHSARENVSTVENSLLISDNTMANIEVPSIDLNNSEDSDIETHQAESLFVRSPIRTRSVTRNRPVARSRSELDLRND